SFTSLSDQLNNFGITAGTATAATLDIGLGDPSGEMDPIALSAGSAEERIFSFNNSTQVLDRLASDYNTLRAQIDTLVKDAQYRGINLLSGDDLVTFFNETNTSSLTTTGTVFTAD